MKRPFLGLGIVATLAFLGACNTSDDPTVKTSSLGNAIAANTVMQMVDPWPEGVDDTNLKTPAEHPQKKTEETPANTGNKTTD